MSGVNIELFPCSGGMSEGFRRAGIEFDYAFDVDPNACESHEKNIGLRPVQVDVRELVRLLEGGWTPGPVRLLVADPPCTPWSRAGKRKGTDDQRDMLRETCRVIELLQPEVFLVGNIPGLDDSKNWPIVQRTIGAIDGYCVDYKALDAADYGVPQRRVRPFWFGHRSGPCVQWPKPTHGDPKTLGHEVLGEDRLPWRTCRDALEHLPLAELGKPARMRMRACNGEQLGSVPDKPARGVGTSNLSDGNVLTHPEGAPRRKRPFHNGHPPSVPDKPAQTITSSDGGGEHSAATTLLLTHPEPKRPGGHSPRGADRFLSPDEPARTVRADGGRMGHHESVLLADGKGKHHVPQSVDKPSATITSPLPGPRSRKALEWPWDRPATTVHSDERIDPPGHHPKSWSSKSDPNCVVLSEKAAAILQGFPEDWVFAGKTKRSRWSQIGQAMPPALAEAVARQIGKQMQTAEPREATPELPSSRV